MDISISKQELKKIIRANIRFILIVSLVVGLLAAGYCFFDKYRNKGSDSAEDMALYEKQMKNYNAQIERIDEYKKIMDNNINSANSALLENPVMKLDPYDAKGQKIFLLLKNGEAKRTDLVKSWIRSFDLNNYYKGNKKLLNTYKTDIVYTSGEAGGVYVSIFTIDGLDSKTLADDLISFFKKKSTDTKANVEIIGSTKITGYNSDLQFIQNQYRGNLVSMQDQLKSIEERIRTLEQPVQPNNYSLREILMSSIKYFIVGFIFGLIIAGFLVYYRIRFGGYVLSERHMKQLFDIERLGACNTKNDQEYSISCANVEALSRGLKSLIVLKDNKTQMDKDYFSFGIKDKNIVICDNIIDDVEAIKISENADGAIICVKYGTSRFERIQMTMNKLNRMGIKLVGYVEI